MDIVALIILSVLGISGLLMILFTQKGEYITSSYKINPYIDRNGCIEMVVDDQYLRKKSFFVNYKYSQFLEEKNGITVTFIKIPILHRKPRILDVYVNKEKINIE